MIRIAICDDNPEVIESMEQFIEKTRAYKIEYDTFESGEEAWKYFQIDKCNYDLYFLDIEMKGMSGIELAKKIRTFSQKSLLVFVTNYSEHVYNVFEMVTFDFISKPISETKFKAVLERALKYLNVVKRNFVFEYRKNTFSIPLGDISYIEKSGRKAFVKTNNYEVFQANLTLKEIWERLDIDMFAQIHVSCIVNLNEIVKIEREEIALRNGERIYIGRTYCKTVKRQHLQYMKKQV